jgi:hypothetical protein
MFESVQDIVEVHDQTAEGCQELQYDNGTQLICASFELPGKYANKLFEKKIAKNDLVNIKLGNS